MFTSPHQVVQPSDAGDGVIAIRWVAWVHHKSCDHQSPHPPSLIASESACVSTSQLCLRSTFCSFSDQRELRFKALKLCVFPTIAKVLNRSRVAVKSATLALERNPFHIWTIFARQHWYTRKQCVFVQYGPDIIRFWTLYQSVNLVYENLQIPVNSDGCTARKTCFWCLAWSDRGELCNSAASVPVQYLPDVTNHVTPGNIGSQDFQAKLFVT